MEDTNFETEIQDEENLKNEYTIWDFFARHTNFFVAFISALVAIFSFFINLIIYLNTSSYLSFWEIDSSYIKINASTQIYNVILAFLFSALTAGGSLFISNTYFAYSFQERHYEYIKRNLKKINKNNKLQNKELLKEQKILLKQRKDSENKQKVNDQLERLEGIQKENIYTKNKIIDIRKTYKKLQRKYKGVLWLSNMICLLVIFLGSLPLMTSTYTENIFFAATVFSVGYVGFIILFNEINNYIFICLWLKKKSNINPDDYNEYISEIKYLPIEKIFLQQQNTKLSNKVIKNAFVFLVLITFIMLITFSYGGYTAAQKQDEFYYLLNEKETYVVIYNDGDALTLKKAHIENESIAIDLAIQKTISAKDVVLYKKTFKNIEIIPVK